MNMEQILAWLNNETMRNQVYHDHKENMMWASFALFLSGFVAVTLWLSGDAVIIYKEWWIVGIFVTTLTTITFVLWQFVNRNIAGNKVEGIICATVELLKSIPEQLDWTMDKDLLLPRFVAKNTRRGISIDRIFLNLLILLVPIIVACVTLIIMVCNK